MNASSNVQPTRKAVVAVAMHAEKLLIIRRSEYVRAPHHFCFPGGGIEAGETHEEAIIREMKEELTLDIQPVARIWTSKTSSGYELNWWRVNLAEEFSITPNAQEVAWWGWCTPQQFLKLQPILSSNQEFMKAWSNKEFEIV
ncbi:MAG: NUDIX domain-containing protein [Pirellulaceae bacterium]|jgi:8-oxo-dGTP diphosphatase